VHRDDGAAAVDTADVSIGDAGSGDEHSEQGGRGRRRRRIDRGLLLASLVIAGGVTLIVWGFFTARTGDDGIDRPEAIEELSPVENAVQVLQQESVRVDLQFGYDAVLVIDDIELPTTVLNEIETEPGAQIDLPPMAIFDMATGVISFQPSDGAPIEEFTEGLHEAKVIYWKAVDGRDSARTYRWHFTVI
jgi:hypothetical protein